MDIQFNSWLTKFKEPFGAVENQTVVQFSIDVSGEEWIHQVSLLVKKNDGPIQEYKMDKQNDKKYSYPFQINEGRGLYYYCFKVSVESYGNHYPIYYGKNKYDCSGRQFHHLEETSWYQLTCYEKEDKAPSWYERAVFYQIFPDRFFNGNEHQLINAPKKNTFIYGSEEDKPMYIRNEDGSINRWDFFGGNLLGIKKKIPYLKELGVTALYLNPLFEATSNHRYDTNDYFNIDAMLGTNEEFKTLVEELHQNGIKIILDGVFSHVGKDSRYFNYSKYYGEDVGAYQTPQSEYYDWFTFHEYPDNFESWWGITDLPEVNKLKPEFQEFIYGKEGVLDFWHDYGIDGWRIDVADEFPNFFLSGIRNRLNKFDDNVLIGEVWEDASNKIAYGEEKQYATNQALHGVMNYPFRETILDLVNERHGLVHSINQLMTLKENYPSFFLNNSLNNIGTHDTKRILTECGGSIEKVKLAFTLLFLLPGVPCIYYGDEVGVEGEADPENRSFYPWGRENHSLRETCENLAYLRQESRALQSGSCHFFVNKINQLLIIYRETNEEKVLSIINISDDDKEMTSENWIGFDLETDQINMILKQFYLPEMIPKKESVILLNN